MHGGSVTLARQFLEMGQLPDLIVASDMLDLATFLGLTKLKSHGIPTVVYFHENQLTYPWSDSDTDIVFQRDNHYAFVNYTSSLVADKVFFNSEYHRASFINALPGFLRQFPDFQNLESMEVIDKKSTVLHLGMDLCSLRNSLAPETKNGCAVILWNHRWEYDKNPDEFFHSLFEIQRRGLKFKLVVLGERFAKSPPIFEEARTRLADEILHWGYVEDRTEYAKWLSRCDILPVTAYQDFFGGSVVEAMYLNVHPLLPMRLAYREHIPNNQHEEFFYQKDEFVNRLQQLINNVGLLRGNLTKHFVEKYDWGTMTKMYDEMLAM